MVFHFTHFMCENLIKTVPAAQNEEGNSLLGVKETSRPRGVPESNVSSELSERALGQLG